MDSGSSKNHHQAALSSYESLDKLNNGLETLKITDDFHQRKQNINNLFNNNNSNNPTNMIISNHNEVGLPQKQQLYMDKHGSNNKILTIDNYMDEINIQSSLNSNTNEADSMKQKQLSDWYYIKTSPKTKPASPYERRKIKNNQNHQTIITIKPSIQSQVIQPPPSSNHHHPSPLELSIPSRTNNNGNNMMMSMIKSSEKISTITKVDKQNIIKCISGTDIHKNSTTNHVQNLRLQEAMMRPLPQVRKNVERQENKVIFSKNLSRTHFNLCYDIKKSLEKFYSPHDRL